VPGRRKNSVGECGCGRRQADFTRTGGVAVAVDDRHLDVRRIRDAQQGVVVEVALHHLTFLDRDLQVACRADAVDRTAHHLCFEAETVDGSTDVDGAHAALDSIAAVAGDAYFHRVCGITAESEMTCDANSTALRHAASPTDALRREPQYVGETAGVECGAAVLSVREFASRTEQAKSEGEWILLRGVCDFVDKALYGERVRCVRRCAP
jgi:hypothetical protein